MRTYHLIVLTALGALGVLAGCQSPEISGDQGNKLTTHTLAADGVEIYSLSVERDWRGTEVEGFLRLIWHPVSLSSGHVDIEIEMPDGRRVEVSDVQPMLRGDSPSKGTRDQRAFFRADFVVVAPDYSIAFVTYHDSPHG